MDLYDKGAGRATPALAQTTARCLSSEITESSATSVAVRSRKKFKGPGIVSILSIPHPSGNSSERG
jgi:hypothetical protein